MEVKPRAIRTESEYGAALTEVDALMDAAHGTPDGDRLDVLVTLVEAYESGRWKIDASDAD